MNSNSILNSSLLDIIFDNRNKEYGAYVLRRDYNKRLLKSLIAMFALLAMFAILFLQKSKPVVLNFKPSIVVDPTNVLPPPQFIKPVLLNQAAVQRHASLQDAPPVIAEDKDVKKTPPTNKQIVASVIGDDKDGPPSEGPTDLPGTKDVAGIKEIRPIAVAAKEVIESSPGIPAQYPGGINEFIKFLKRNLKAPKELEEDAMITVKVKFIVSLNGDLLGFNVIQSGGEDFDNEVIRVLKKMPKWIPGKSNGENVSSYYTIPVKFTEEK